MPFKNINDVYFFSNSTVIQHDGTAVLLSTKWWRC